MPALLALSLVALAAAPLEERRFLSAGFDGLRVIGPYEVEVVPGSPGATASGDREALDGVSVWVEGGTLVISGPLVALVRGAPVRRAPLKLRVATTGLRAVAAFDGAAIAIGDIHTRRLDLQASGDAALRVGTLDVEELNLTSDTGGNISITGKADRLHLHGGDAARVVADKLTAGEAVLDWSSPNPLRIAVRYAASVSNYGKGQVTVIGKPECRVRGGGPVRCNNGVPGR